MPVKTASEQCWVLNVSICPMSRAVLCKQHHQQGKWHQDCMESQLENFLFPPTTAVHRAERVWGTAAQFGGRSFSASGLCRGERRVWEDPGWED